MNYHKIYNDLINTRKSLRRTKSDGQYYENHHIIPACLGGSDDDSNMVLLTAKEHWIAHCLLAKMSYDNKQNSYKMNQALVNMGRVISESKRKISTLYASARKEIAIEVSKKHTNTLIVIEAATGKRIGRVSKDHPKVLNGEYVFFHTGTKRSDEFKEKQRKANTAEKNSNYSGLTDDEILEMVYGYYLEGNTYIGGAKFNQWRKSNKIPLHFVDWRFSEYGGFEEAMIKKYNLTKENFKYIRSDEHKKALSKANVGNSWYSNDKLKLSKQSKNHPGDDWYKGRKYGNKN
ncbi:MAG: HNH endonuclease [Alphaproteobacteria bacterium]|nr:HNH endonuclease [Alphaproteobacteria bacterium]